MSYEDEVRRLPGAIKIVLPTGGGRANCRPFWSRGWRSCELGCRQPLDRPAKLHYFEERDSAGVRRGWRCCTSA